MFNLPENKQSIEIGIKPMLKRHGNLYDLGRAVWHSQRYWYTVKSWFTRSRAISDYFESHEIRKLQIGAGDYALHGWFNTDLRPGFSGCYHLDARRPFPFENGSFQYVNSEHMIEHLSYAGASFMLRECFRVLKAGGKLRISTPDLGVLVDLYASENSKAKRRYATWVAEQFLPQSHGPYPCFIINHMFYSWGHKFIYDRVTLQNLVEEIGYKNISWHTLGESDDANLCGIESHGKSTGEQDIVQFETMVLQVTRP